MLFYLLVGKINLVIESEIFLTMHITLEFASVIVSMLVSIFCWYDYVYHQRQKMLIMAIVFCILGITDFIHTLSYLGMPNFITDNSANKASTYWIIARLVQGMGIFLAVCSRERELRLSTPTTMFALTTLVSVASLIAVAVYLPYLPSMYDPVSKAQTTLKVFSEYIVIGLYSLTIISLLNNQSTDKRDLWLVYALAIGIFGEVAFATYDHVYSSYNLLGHMFKIISFSVILKGLFDEALGQLHKTNEALETANHQLKKTDRLKDEFLANTNHELRSPLTAIIAFTELLLDKHTGSLNEMQTDYINEINDSSNDLLNRVNELRDLSRIKAGKMVLRTEKVILKEVVKNQANRIRPQFDNKNVNLKVNCLNNLLIKGDEERISQILNNLLSNALKFTPSGGEVLINARKDCASEQVEITVEDNGIGINLSEQEAVFQMFYQVDGTSSRSYGGAGIGLSLVKNLVELHGGIIKLESCSGKGSKFTFALPMYNKKGNTEVQYGT